MNRTIVFAFALALASIPAVLGEPAGRPTSGEVAPVLEPDPEVGKTLDSLKPGHAAVLPRAAVTGDLNAEARKYGLQRTGPGGRNYCVKMMWMPERRRALYFGANHGSPHRLNDVWEYDLAANTWVCLYGPDVSKDISSMAGWKDTRLQEGVLITERGGPAVIGHQWWQGDYDAQARAMLFLTYWPNVPKQIRQDYFETGKYAHQPPLWRFDPEAKTWSPIRSRKPAPGAPAAIYFHYVPSLKKMVYIDAGWRGNGMWTYNSEVDSWEKLHGGEPFKAKNNPATPFGDGVLVYAPDRDLLIASCRKTASLTAKLGGRTVHYDIAKDKWEAVGDGLDMPRGHTSFTPCGYDTVNRVMLLYEPPNRHSVTEEHRLWAYDPAQREWSRFTPEGPFPPPGNGKAIGYYDEARNAFVVDRNGSIWVYRHKTRTSEPANAAPP
jgi:hypothetical protein